MRSYLESFLFEQGFGESFPNRPPAGFQGTICCREKEFLRGATEEDACLHRALAQVFGRHPSSGTLQPVWRTYCRGTWDTYLRNHGRSVHTSKQLLWHASFNPISHRFGGFLPGKTRIFTSSAKLQPVPRLAARCPVAQEWFCRSSPVDTSRIFLFGFSDGATEVMELASTRLGV